ncbi:hypothetical protein YH65_09300 [Sulfurovum lithotrophicum]|uniref:Uncharacterized protein n=1 Tax=Sulfurovum lithotrophicum TaxID=206403 RepID=A0A7U4M2M7_9BACT|nr:hypothetical protein [Sulfurovum lithotrophicum]AKF25549.1 hypothetical protein YH65_09300 [Sulfurovum lithotrophicum]
MGKRPVLFWVFTAFVIIIGLAIEVRPLHDMVWKWVEDMYHFAKENLIAILTAFFLVKGKFILKIFLKKILFLSATGLGKRYLIERVFTYHFKIHFLNHIALDLKRLLSHVKKNFISFPLTKKIITAFAFLGSLGYVGKFMGTMLALKVFIAKVWSFLLAIVLKAGASILYFFTDYIWGSWLAPIIEVVIFSWLLDLLEKVPFLTNSIHWMYRTVRKSFRWFEERVGRLFHYPVQRSLKWLLGKTRRMIYKFIGYKRVPAYKQLRELRAFEPNRQQQLKQKREKQKEQRSKRISRYDRFKKERKKYQAQ